MSTIHEREITDLAQTENFVAAVWFAWTKTLPDPAMTKFLNTCLTVIIDHGAEPPSAVATTAATQAGKSLAEAVAAGILTFGPQHGNAGSGAAAWFKENISKNVDPKTAVKNSVDNGAIIPGFGHRLYEVDPRTTILIEAARPLLTKTKHVDFALAAAAELSTLKNKPMPLNVDGALGAIIADLNLSDDLADAIFILGRTAGLIMRARKNSDNKN